MRLLSFSRAAPPIPDSVAHPRRPALARGLLALAAIALAAHFFRDAILGAPVDVQEVVRGDLVQTVVASGRVTTPQRVSVGAVVTERVARIPVAEGQTVRRGDVLIALDDRDERAAIAQATPPSLRPMRASGSCAKWGCLPPSRRRSRRRRISVSRDSSTTATSSSRRKASSASRRWTTRSATSTSRRASSTRRASRCDSIGPVRQRLPDGARRRCSQARAALAAATARLDQTTIRAPADGILIGRSVEPGDVVQPGRELMVLAPAGETQIVVSIDEKNLAATPSRDRRRSRRPMPIRTSDSLRSSSTSIRGSTRCAVPSR